MEVSVPELALGRGRIPTFQADRCPCWNDRRSGGRHDWRGCFDDANDSPNSIESANRPSARIAAHSRRSVLRDADCTDAGSFNPASGNPGSSRPRRPTWQAHRVGGACRQNSSSVGHEAFVPGRERRNQGPCGLGSTRPFAISVAAELVGTLVPNGAHPYQSARLRMGRAP